MKAADNTNTASITTTGHLNGKKQVVDLLRILSPTEKKRILRGIKQKNPQLAQDLISEGVDIEVISELSQEQLYRLIHHLSPEILGLALKTVSKKLQQNILRLCERSYAEVAFSIMTNAYDHDETKMQQAQEKVLETALGLFGNSFTKMPL
ncbi:MAG: hypothetical protein HQK52_00020 [Oligoflexia bacterium]|nr:hypothetical protein [Oligoflexia bacterium]